MTPPLGSELGCPTWEVREGDALERLQELPAGGSQCCVTSPPYWGQRDYDAAGQIGLEDQLCDYLDRLVGVFREVRRVLADDGILWVNIGDTFSGGRNGAPGPQADMKHQGRTRGWVPPQARGGSGLANKQLIGVPWRLALALQADGWWLRADVIWDKPNTIPDPATDRPSRNHEYVFLLAKGPRYYYDADSTREASDPTQEAHNQRYAKLYDSHTAHSVPNGQPGNVNHAGIHSRPGPGGRPRRSVWHVSTVPFVDGHFATFPPKLIEPMIVAGSRPGDLVLDPFSGAATTGVVAVGRGRRYLGIELKPEYAELSRRRLRGVTEPLPGIEVAA